MDKDEQKKLMKQAWKEATSEWLDALAAKFGKWSFRVIAGMLLVALTYFILTMSGWHQ